MSQTARDTIEALLKKAVESKAAGEALHFSQAACNAATALRMMLEFPKAP